LLNIRSEEKKIAKQQLVVSALLAVASIGAIVASVKYALTAFYQSGFYSYASLLLSDPDMVLRYWREFGLALLESLPVIGIVCFLIAVFALLMSFRSFARNMRFGFAPSFAN
jgi:hypothetical protein